MIDATRTLAALSEEFVEVTLRFDPVAATLAGIHDYDARYPDDSPQGFEARIAWVRDFTRRLDAVADPGLVPTQRVDHALLRSRVAALQLQLEVVRPHTHNPVRYPVTAMNGVFALLSGTFAPIEERKELILARLNAASEYLAGARATLERVPSVHAQTALEVARSGPGFVDDVARSLSHRFPGEVERIEFAATQARLGFIRYQEFLEQELPARIGGSIAIGEEAMNAMLEREHLLGRTAREVERLGAEHIERTQALLEAEARRIDPARSWQQQVEDAKSRHPERAHVREAYAAETERARRFVIDRRIAPVPEGTLQVIDTPVFERSLTPYAGYSAPGPFEADPTGQLWVTPIDLSRPRDEQEEQLAGHCWAAIPLIVVHESYPGHHLQTLCANRASTRLRQVVASDFFSEGWALYCEELMYEQGFLAEPASRLLQLKDLLFRACRVVLDVRLHCGHITVDEAAEFLTREALIEPVNAVLEAKRYALTPTQPMSYLVGKLDLLALRADAERRLGSRFSLHDFHAALLAEGTLPIALVRDGLWQHLGVA